MAEFLENQCQLLGYDYNACDLNDKMQCFQALNLHDQSQMLLRAPSCDFVHFSVLITWILNSLCIICPENIAIVKA
jgi:hypothetical protein